MRYWVGITDYDWFRFLAVRPELLEVNFWQPKRWPPARDATGGIRPRVADLAVPAPSPMPPPARSGDSARMVRARQYRLGLLFVHGMGEQERGDTITQMGDALTEWLRRWIRPPGNFTIREATLREGHETCRHDGGRRRTSRSSTDADGSSQEWLLAESFWAGALVVPGQRVAVGERPILTS